MLRSYEKEQRKNAKICGLLYRLMRSEMNSLNDAYDSYSNKKRIAENEILEEMRSRDGWHYRVISKSPNFFSCGYLYETVDTEAGERLVHMVYHTKKRNDDIDVTQFMVYDGFWTMTYKAIQLALG